MLNHSLIDVAFAHKLASNMCDIRTLETTRARQVLFERVLDQNSIQQQSKDILAAAAAQVKNIRAKPTIGRLSIKGDVVVVDNSNGLFQLIGLIERPLCHEEFWLDSRAQPLMLGVLEAWDFLRIK